MDIRNTAPRAPPSTNAGMDDSEELLAEVDEPPEHQSKDNDLSWSLPHLTPVFGKATPGIFQRRESLLTRQLHSETEHTDEDDIASAGPPRTLSTQSTWSVASTAELTSDDGHSVPSPAISPPLPPTAVTARLPITEKSLVREPKILGQEEVVAAKQPVVGSEQSVEAGLGRKRCISFACGSKDKRPPTSQPTEPQPQPAPEQHAATASPPKRKCTLKFVCPTRTATTGKAAEKTTPSGKRAMSPPPPERRPSANVKAEGLRAHRGSDSTITHSSPKSTRKMPAVVTIVPTPTSPVARTQARKMSNGSTASTEATRFHEFGTSDDEPEEWVQEMTCHRSRLTVNDTLKKENVIRKACEEAEEEAVEEEEEEEEAIDNDDELDVDEADEDGDEYDNDEDDDGEDDDEDDEELSDEGFRTDDEEGFAASDSEGEGSDEEWWRPGGPSTAATSIDQLDRMISHTRSNDAILASSIGSASSGRISPRMSATRRRHHRKHHGDSIPIHNRLPAPDLPDSTDFVCGTLDEDRPLEQAYINSIKQREAAKHVARPQDIDPTFPTSDPELDEEDDEDLADPQPSESENFMHGELDELDGDLTARRRPSPRPRARSNVARSPPPPVRHRSPAPAKRSQQTHRARSPPPPSRRGTARSPAPRKLFGHSPRPARSPTPVNRATSPPNTRRASLTASQHLGDAHHGFASRSHVTHTASLPRGGGFMLSKLNTLHLDDVDETPVADSTNVDSPILPKRGAIDIVKGLERKRQRRKERLYAKACAKAAAKGEKAYKVKPGKGAERMREVGLELQRYHGKGEHILSM